MLHAEEQEVQGNEGRFCCARLEICSKGLLEKFGVFGVASHPCLLPQSVSGNRAALLRGIFYRQREGYPTERMKWTGSPPPVSCCRRWRLSVVTRPSVARRITSDRTTAWGAGASRLQWSGSWLGFPQSGAPDEETNSTAGCPIERRNDCVKNVNENRMRLTPVVSRKCPNSLFVATLETYT